MAAFSYHPFLLDSSFLYPDTTTVSNNNSKMSGFFEEPNNNNNLPCVSHQLYQPPPPPADPLQEVSSLNFSSTTKVSLSSNNSSSLVPENTSMELKKRKYHSNDGSNSSINSAQSKDTREVVLKGKKQRKNTTNGPTRDVEVKKKTRGGDKKDDQEKKIQTEEAPTGYIHVRARRGQATDSHSLAERVRREKISERMKLLQALVPGCDKVTGKALMLDEIINYVQSLQNQVEFLSMKIASVNPMFYDFGMDLDAFMVKPERMSSLEMSSLEAPQQPDVQQGSPNQSTTNAFNTANNYPLLDNSTLLQFQQAQMQNILSQNNGQLLWDSDEQRQRNISQSSGFTNNLVSFH